MFVCFPHISTRGTRKSTMKHSWHRVNTDHRKGERLWRKEQVARNGLVRWKASKSWDVEKPDVPGETESAVFSIVSSRKVAFIHVSFNTVTFLLGCELREKMHVTSRWRSPRFTSRWYFFFLFLFFFFFFFFFKVLTQRCLLEDLY